jgi:hypothetical protein
MDWRAPLSDMDFGTEETQAVQAVLSNRRLTMSVSLTVRG